MKRSHAILAIAAFIRSYNERDYEDSKFQAEKLLRGLILLGFKPPGYMKPIPIEEDGHQYPLVPSDFLNDKGVWCTPGIQEWEPEDET